MAQPGEPTGERADRSRELEPIDIDAARQVIVDAAWLTSPAEQVTRVAGGNNHSEVTASVLKMVFGCAEFAPAFLGPESGAIFHDVADWLDRCPARAAEDLVGRIIYGDERRPDITTSTDGLMHYQRHHQGCDLLIDKTDERPAPPVVPDSRRPLEPHELAGSDWHEADGLPTADRVDRRPRGDNAE
jgi:hypothetical protein